MKDFATPLNPSKEWMPKRAPLPMPIQNFRKPFRDPSAQSLPNSRKVWGLRGAVLASTLVLTTGLTKIFLDWRGLDGLTGFEISWAILVAVTFFWISFVACLSAAGAVASSLKPETGIKGPIVPLDVAILVPIYNETVSDVMANMRAMLDDLRHKSHHKYTAYLLSDSQDPDIILAEEQTFERARSDLGLNDRLYYRRRASNVDYKTGNLAEWVRNWGAGHAAMLVLDADSLMSASAIIRLSNTLAANPGIGLVQGAMRIFRADTLWARLQQFSGAAFGTFPAQGLNVWSGTEGNYFGHNAIMRTRAFAGCAGLPKMPSRSQSDTPIFSHDFVEAALLRRAGWGIKILPDLAESYEETPESLIDFIRRDRRWCQGNMQHLRLLAIKGLHPISRFHMFFNALTYLMSPAWLLLIVIWTAVGFAQTAQGISATQTDAKGLGLLLIVYSLLLAPKFAAAIGILLRSQQRQDFGGGLRFTASVLAEILASILVAPIMMFHQSIGVARSAFGFPAQWGAQVRRGVSHNMVTLLRFHMVETLLGTVLLLGALTGFVSLWLLPIAISLSGSAILSYLGGQSLPKSVLISPLDISQPSIVTRAESLRGHSVIGPDADFHHWPRPKAYQL